MYKIIIFISTFLFTNVAYSQLTVPKYCAMVRDDKHTEYYITTGLKMYEDQKTLLIKNPNPTQIIQIQNVLNRFGTKLQEDSKGIQSKVPSQEQINKILESINKFVVKIYEKDLAISYEIDASVNRELPYNNFPNIARDQVWLQREVLDQAKEFGGSIIENKEWVYDRCMSVVSNLKQ